VASRADARMIGVAAEVPFGNRSETLVLKPGQDSAAGRSIFTFGVSREYFDVLRIPVIAGRLFVDGDVARGAIVVSQSAAERLWPGLNPIGQPLTIGTPREVVGVVKDADTENKAADEGSALPKIYEQFGGGGSTTVPNFVARNLSPDALREITALAARLAPASRVRARSLTERFSLKVDDSRQLALLVGILGVVSLVLVSIGIFGVFAYVVQQRTREIGIRMALGAQRRDVVRTIVASSARPIVIGLVVGLGGALAESRLLRNYLYGVSAVDPVTYGAIVVILGVAALVAVYLPARRATRIVPSEALRGE
jgi:ABC-type antimicrobial peptide transport system permease subunit